MAKTTDYKFELKPIAAGDRQPIDVGAIIKRYEARHARWLRLQLWLPRSYFGERKP